ncbi:hypothetical protein [Luteolibacter soli]|uniref:DUF3592 domain-containing protein n=1 Tax=Luteolibacter soli TaxID=3135280 RepID=A0ABU9ARF6_9BACT
MSRLKIAAILALVIGPCLAFVGFKERQRIGKIEKDGVEVAGIPTGGRIETGRKGGKTHRITVTYPAGGPPNATSKEFKVTGDFFESISSGETITADTVKVKMLADQPEEAFIVDGSDDDRVLFPVGLAAFALGGVGTASMFRKGRQG